MSAPLVCPTCELAHGPDERFCVRCGMPLVFAEVPVVEAPVSERRDRARKVQRRYTEGDAVVVAGARHQAEAELIQGLLLEEGIPSMLRRTRGFDVPDMLAAGPRDVLVPASGAQAAREVLLKHEIDPSAGGAPTPPPMRLLLALSAAVALVALIAWLGTELAG